MRARWVAAALATLVLAACGTDQPVGPMVLRAEGVERVTPPADAPVADVVRGITKLGYDLAPTAAGNWVASPTSIAYAMAMVRAGAAGQTAAEIDKTLGFPAQGLHEAFNALTRQVVTAERPPPRSGKTRAPGTPPQPPVMCVSNALFPASGFPIRDGFLRTLASQYGAGVYPVDFHKADAKDLIDAWARQQTADRIKKVFDQIDADTALILANTVYLKADWATSFRTFATSDEAFHRSDDSTVSVPTMHLTSQFRYAEGDGWQAVELPYTGDFAMWVLLPVKGSPRDLLTPSTMAAVSGGFSDRGVAVSLPRWDFSSDVALKDELIRLGIVSAFDANKADFSGMSDTPLYLAKAIHRATITVDENGTEAAAVTAIEAMPTSAGPGADVSFTADHPFAFAIVHTPTNAPVFVGQVADPAAH